MLPIYSFQIWHGRLFSLSLRTPRGSSSPPILTATSSTQRFTNFAFHPSFFFLQRSGWFPPPFSPLFCSLFIGYFFPRVFEPFGGQSKFGQIFSPLAHLPPLFSLPFFLPPLSRNSPFPPFSMCFCSFSRTLVYLYFKYGFCLFGNFFSPCVLRGTRLHFSRRTTRLVVRSLFHGRIFI